jgi:hypothetical protein
VSPSVLRTELHKMQIQNITPMRLILPSWWNIYANEALYNK